MEQKYMRWQSRQDELDMGRKTAVLLAIFDHCDDEPDVGRYNAISVEQYGSDKFGGSDAVPEGAIAGLALQLPL